MNTRDTKTLAMMLDALLPQTQCEDCGFPGCLPYAQALAEGLAPIDKCPPGGVNTLLALSKVLKIDATPYLRTAEAQTRPPALAVIREAECIGCTKCIQACPVDAIMGARTFMHTVITQECTGCGLCIEPCPVDCIDLIPQAEATYDKNLARRRFHAKKIRLLREQQEKQQAYRDKRRLAAITTDALDDKKAKHAYILEALTRSQAKKQ